MPLPATQDTAPAAVGTPGGALSSSLQEVSNRTSMLPVPAKIHMYWRGTGAAFARHLQHVTSTAALNPAYRTRLHLLADCPADAAGIRAMVRGSAVKVKDLADETWFQAFSQTPRYRQFDASHKGARPHPAAGADVIKTELLARKGGVWSDVDNIPISPLPVELHVAAGGMLTAGPARFARWGGQLGVHCSTLATHADNPTLHAINAASFARFRELDGILFEANPITRDPERHFQLISETGGSVHLSQELKQRNPTFRTDVEHLDAQGSRAGGPHVIFDTYFTPQATTGCGTLDADQLLTLVERLSPPDHLII